MGMTEAVRRPLRSRLPVLPVVFALVAGALAGGLTSYYGIQKTDTIVNNPPMEIESPNVTGRPMPEAIDTLVEAGFRVVAVGHGDVMAHEIGVVGQTLRVQGEHGYELRYCTARLPDCVPIDGPAFRP